MLARRLVGLLLPAVLALAVGGCSDSPTAPSSITVIAFGDSITFGVGTTGSNNYVSRLSARTGVPIENAGRPGDTTADALGRLDGSVLSRDPDIVIAFLGGNDILQGVPVSERIGNPPPSSNALDGPADGVGGFRWCFRLAVCRARAHGGGRLGLVNSSTRSGEGMVAESDRSRRGLHDSGPRQAGGRLARSAVPRRC
jgi:hypothetical protein